jgi:hypothetical protein
VVVAEFNCSVAPLQSGPLLLTVGVAGGLGSVNVNGPASAEGHPLSVTLTAV